MTFPDTVAALSGTAHVGPTPPDAATTREGDLWMDTSAAPYLLRVYVEGVWEPAVDADPSTTGGATSPQANLMWKADATPGDPGGQRIGTDTGDPASCTTVSIASVGKNSVVISGFLKLLATGDTLLVWDRFNTENAVRFKVTGPAENWGTWFLVPVQPAGVQGNEPADWADVLVAFTAAG
jgi:hypothetical protein